MKKVCQPSPPVRRRRALKKTPDHETSKLEQKLDGLVTLLKSATQGGQGIVNTTAVNSALEDAIPNHGRALEPTLVSNNEVGNEENAHAKPLPRMADHPESNYATTSSSPKSTPQNSLSVHSGIDYALEPSVEEAELYLNRFRNEIAIQLPFIIISSSLTAQQLRQDRPVLWLTIMAVGTTNSAQQIALSKQAKAMIPREALTEGVRNMDLLLAVLVYCTWYVIRIISI
jgi:hypothetical protein